MELTKRQEELKQHYQNQVEEMSQSIDTKREYKKNLKAEIERLRNSDRRPQALAAAIASNDRDIEKLQGFIRDCTKHVNALDVKYGQLVAEQEAKNNGNLFRLLSSRS